MVDTKGKTRKGKRYVPGRHFKKKWNMWKKRHERPKVGGVSLGEETVLSIEWEAWPMVKWPRLAINEYPPPPPLRWLNWNEYPASEKCDFLISRIIIPAVLVLRGAIVNRTYGIH